MPKNAGDLVLVVGCGMRRYREYLLAGAANRHPLWLLVAAEPTWQRDYVQGYTVVDLNDPDEVMIAAAELAATRTVVGALSWDETLVVATAQVASRLALPGPGAAGIQGCRDKRLSRQRLSEVGLLQPVSIWVDTPAAAVAAAAQIGYPVVVKPRGMGASIGVVLAADAEAVSEAYAVADQWSLIGAPAYRGGALIEEYLSGPEISVDSAVVDGDLQPMFVARKMVGMAPAFEEIGHTVDSDDPLLHDAAMVDMLAEAHRAIGFGSGITHTEVKLTPLGPTIVEINGRLGGDLIPLLGWWATGIDPAAAAVDIARGRRPDLARSGRTRTVGIRFGYPDHDCRARSVEVPPVDPAAGVLAAQPLIEEGAELRLPPDGYISRHSYVICEGPTPDACLTRLEAAARCVRLESDALEPNVSLL